MTTWLSSQIFTTANDIHKTALMGFNPGAVFSCQMKSEADASWRAYDELSFVGGSAFLGEKLLKYPRYHIPSSSLRYSFGKGAAHGAGTIYFTEDHRAFLGTAYLPDGRIAGIRGNKLATVFKTTRRALKLVDKVDDLTPLFWAFVDQVPDTGAAAFLGPFYKALQGEFAATKLSLPNDAPITQTRNKQEWNIGGSGGFNIVRDGAKLRASRSWQGGPTQFTLDDLTNFFWGFLGSTTTAWNTQLLQVLADHLASRGGSIVKNAEISERIPVTQWVIAGADGKAQFLIARQDQGLMFLQMPADSGGGDWQTFTVGTEWVGDELQTIFDLGSTDVSSRTAVVAVSMWQTSVSMIPDSLLGSSDSFDILIDYSGREFSGIYTDSAGAIFDWSGSADVAEPHPLIAKLTSAQRSGGHEIGTVPHEMTAALRDSLKDGPDLSVMDLMNISCIEQVTANGQPRVLDVAQTRTGKYFQDLLVNALDLGTIRDFFGGPSPVPPGVQAVMERHSKFYKDKSVINLGQMIHDVFATDETHKDIVARIDIDKLQQAWKDLATDPDYGDQARELYEQGYRDGVASFQPYIESSPKDWATKLHNFLTSEQFLSIWRVQVANHQFNNVKQQMYEWYTQLCVLDPDEHDRAQDMLNTMFGVVLRTQFDRVKWTEDLQPYLAQAIQNMLDGKADDFKGQMEAEDIEHIKQAQELMREMVSQFDTVEECAAQIAIAIGRGGKDNIYEGIAEMFEREGQIGKASWFRTNGTKLMGALGPVMYAAGAGFVLEQMITGKDLRPIDEINLALLAVGLTVKATEKLFATSMGRWISRKVISKSGSYEEFATGMMKWFTEDGVEAEGWAVKIFTKSAAEFFAKRIGPALAVVGLVLCALDIKKAVDSGDTRDLGFEITSTTLALGETVAIGFELASFAWAGPVGLALAVVGAIVALVQMIWGMSSPPPPPPDPIEVFVDGPLAQAGYVKA
jgi:hypothetical protein